MPKVMPPTTCPGRICVLPYREADVWNVYQETRV